MTNPVRITVFGENVHETTSPVVAGIYPTGMHTCIAEALNQDAGLRARTVTLQMVEHGLTAAVLAETDVLFWWGHAAHDKVEDAVVERIAARVLAGMGLVVLHSGHHAKIFKRLLGTTCDLTWREAGEKERLWVTAPGHPIVAGVPAHFEIEHEEMYGEPFGIPEPQETIFISWFQGGEVFRSGATWTRGSGRIFYFSPGHEVYPIYHHPDVQRVIANGIRWARPQGTAANTPRHVPVGQARENIPVRGGTVH